MSFAAGARKLQVWLLLAATLAVACLAATVSAQSSNTGTISGNVADPTGAFVVNATVKLVSVDEGTVTTAKVNSRGEYLFSSVKTGGYILTVSAPTFETFTANSISVNASENVRVDAKLTTGSADTVVTVEESSSSIDTRSATIQAVIDPKLVENLPVDGNNVVSLAALLPGVVDVNAPTTFTNDQGGPTFTSSGSRSNQNLYLLDGAFWNNVYYNTGINFPPHEMTREVSVQLVNFKAQYGRNVGSVFNVLTLSGTNQIHGRVWEYIQNKALNAYDYISKANPKLVQNQFGGSIGGPIIRDKLFYFLGVQDLRSVAGVTSRVTLPTAAERGLNPDGSIRPCITPLFATRGGCASFAGDYAVGTDLINGGLSNPFYSTNKYASQAATELMSTALTPAGHTAPYNATQCITDLMTLAGNSASTTQAAHIPNAEIPQECFNPVAFNIYNKYFHIPTVNGVPVSVPTSETSTANQPRNDWNGLARGDLNLGRHQIDARYYVTNTNDVTANSVTTTGQTLTNYDQDFNQAAINSGNIGDTWVVSPNLLNVFRADYKRYTYTINPIDTTTLLELGSNVTDPGHPTLPIVSANNRFTLGSANSAYSYSVNADEEITESVSWTHGNHNFQAGAQFLDLQYIHRFDQPVRMDAGGSVYTQLGLADFTMGLIGTLTVGNSTNIGAQDHAYYFYGQDDWRVLPRLTINLGLRYELAKPWNQPDGQSVTFIPGYQSFKFRNVPASLAYQGDPGVPSAIIKTTYNNLAPRVGLAYDLLGNGSTVLRFGFGVFYDALNANTTGVGQPYHYQATYSEPNGSFSQPLYNSTPVPANYTTPATAIFAYPISVNFADPNVTEPYTEAVNLGIQRKIGKASIEATYVGKFGRHQIVPVDLNPDIYSCNPNNTYFQTDPLKYCTNADTSQKSDTDRVTYPGFNYGGQGIVDNNSIGTSNYNGVQTIYTQRSKMLNVTASYTYSRSLDDQSSGTTNASSLPRTYQNANVSTNYGPSDFQSTHIFNMGWTLKLPELRTGNSVVRGVLNGWNFAGIYNARTGHPFSVTTQSDYQMTREPGQRAPLAPGLTSYQPYPGKRHRTDEVAHWFNFNSFQAVPPLGYTNSTSRNFLYGPGYINTSLSLRRSINLEYRGMRLDLRAEAFNAFNTPNLANPAASISTSLTSTGNNGNILSTVGTNGVVGTNARRVQLAFVLNY